MEERSILIIGAGVAGLATGCYARMNGYRTQIVEMASRAGGVCTSWHRQGYTFDSCIQWLVGSRPGGTFHRQWQELGALAGRQIVNREEFMRVEGRDGRTLIVYTDADRLEEHLRELAPADAALSHAFCELIRRCAVLSSMPGGEERGHLATAAAWLSLAARVSPAAPSLIGSLRLTWQEFTARFTDHFLRDALRSLFDLPDVPFLACIVQLAWMHGRDAGYPIGGSLAFAQGIEQRCRDLGGEVTYRTRVEQILVEGGRAAGVRLGDGSEMRADYVVSAADGHSTIFELLEGRYADARIRQQYVPQRVFNPLVQVSLGVARDLTAISPTLQFPLRTPQAIAGQVRESLLVRHYSYDPTMAPPGKAALTILLDTTYDTWAELSRDSDRYSAEKRSIADAVVAALEERFPGLASAVEVVDVATPMTWVHHTGIWRGAFDAWLPTRGWLAGNLLRASQNTLPGLANFYMVGQWVSGFGLPRVASSGRDLVKRLCKHDGKDFTTILASHPPARLLPDFGEPVATAGGSASEHLGGT